MIKNMLSATKNEEGFLPGLFYICATLAHLFNHERIKKSPFSLDEASVWLRRLGYL